MLGRIVNYEYNSFPLESRWGTNWVQHTFTQCKIKVSGIHRVVELCKKKKRSHLFVRNDLSSRLSLP